MNAPLSLQQQEDAYLARLGERVRAWRAEHGMSRKALALASGVSERYLAQLEVGRGNISVLLLRKLARAMGVAVERLVREDDTVDRVLGTGNVRIHVNGRSPMEARSERAELFMTDEQGNIRTAVLSGKVQMESSAVRGLRNPEFFRQEPDDHGSRRRECEAGPATRTWNTDRAEQFWPSEQVPGY